MAELENTTIKQEPIYLNYGLNQIDLLAFLDSAASGLEEYVSRQGWSLKRKDLFRKAYLDIMSRGVTGATNTSGVWEVTHNGAQIDLDSLSKKEREMYGEAAYYIQQLMNGISPKEAEPVKKEDLPLFDNKYFTLQFLNHVSNNMFGGRDFSASEDWDVLDERGENGLRGVTKRANKLAELLLSYSDSLEEGKYNFENSPFKDLNDLKSRIGNAISALKTEDLSDDVPALNAIGINPRDWFYNGANDSSGKTDVNGNPLTYEQLALLEQQLAEQDALNLAAKLEAEAKANRGVLLSLGGIHGTDARTRPQEYVEYLAKNHGTGQEAFNSINSLVLQLLNEANTTRSLNPDKKRQLGNLLYYIREKNPNYQGLGNGERTNLSDLDWKELQTHKNLASQNKNDYIRLPWQTSDGKYTYADNLGNIYFMKPSNKQKLEGPKFTRSLAYNNYKNNFLTNSEAGRNTRQQEYLNQEGAENAEIGAIVADIASIIDPEPFSAMGLSLGAAGARNYAKLQQPGKWSLMDYGSQGLDYLTSIIGAVPIAGDAVLAGKVIKNLRRLARFGAWSDVVLSTPGLKNIWDKKIMGDEKLTKEDWRIIGTAIRGLVSHGRLSKSNLAARTAMQGRGVETGNAWHQKIGLTSSAKSSGNKTDVLKVTKNGNSDEIPISPKQKLDLKDAFKKVKPSERTAEARRILGEEAIPEGVEVKVSDGVRSTARNWNRFTRRTSDSFGTRKQETTRTATKSDEEFENFLRGRTNWDKIKAGSNSYIRRIDRQLAKITNNRTSEQLSELGNNNSPLLLNEQGLTPQQYRESQVGRKQNISNNEKLSEDIKLNREAINDYRNMLKGKFTNNQLLSGDAKIAKHPVLVVKLSDGSYNVIFKGEIVANERNQIEIQKTIRDLVKRSVLQGKSNSNSKISAKEMGKLLKLLKAKGWLKQGGTIEKSLDETIIEFLNKQK